MEQNDIHYTSSKLYHRWRHGSCYDNLECLPGLGWGGARVRCDEEFPLPTRSVSPPQKKNELFASNDAIRWILSGVFEANVRCLNAVHVKNRINTPLEPTSSPF